MGLQDPKPRGTCPSQLSDPQVPGHAAELTSPRHTAPGRFLSSLSGWWWPHPSLWTSSHAPLSKYHPTRWKCITACPGHVLFPRLAPKSLNAPLPNLAPHAGLSAWKASPPHPREVLSHPSLPLPALCCSQPPPRPRGLCLEHTQLRTPLPCSGPAAPKCSCDFLGPTFHDDLLIISPSH